MRLGVVSFTPSRWPTAGAVGLIALTLYLGIWQTHRGDEKEERQRLLDSRIRETPVVLTGSVARAEPLVYRRARDARATTWSRRYGYAMARSCS